MDALIVVASVIALAWVGASCVEVGRTIMAPRRDGTRVGEAQAIFPLAYEIEEDGPDRRYRPRLDLARRLAEQHGLSVWCLGGHPGWLERSNVWHSKRYLVERGLAPDAVRTIDEFLFLGESLETIQEVLVAAELARYLGVRRLVVISDMLHLAQIRLVLEREGVEPIWVRTPLMPAWTLSEIRYLLVRLAMIALTLVDRHGWMLGWLGLWRRRGFGRRLRAAGARGIPG